MSVDIADIRERLAKIETKQEHHAQAISDGFDKIGNKLDSMDKRLSSVEIKSASFGSIAGAITSLGLTLIAGKITGKV